MIQILTFLFSVASLKIWWGLLFICSVWWRSLFEMTTYIILYLVVMPFLQQQLQAFLNLRIRQCSFDNWLWQQWDSKFSKVLCHCRLTMLLSNYAKDGVRITWKVSRKYLNACNSFFSFVFTSDNWFSVKTFTGTILEYGASDKQHINCPLQLIMYLKANSLAISWVVVAFLCFILKQ